MWNWKIEGYVFETPIVNEVFNNVFTVFDNRLVNEQFAKRDIDFKCMFKVLYVGLVSHEFKTKVINWFFHDLGVEIFPIFKSCKLSGLFFLKSQTPKKLIANAVYKYTCFCDTSLAILKKQSDSWLWDRRKISDAPPTSQVIVALF